MCCEIGRGRACGGRERIVGNDEMRFLLWQREKKRTEELRETLKRKAEAK